MRKRLSHRLRKKDPGLENRAHVSLACIQNLTFNYIILPAVYQATNKIRYKQSQSWVLPGHLTNEAPEWCGMVMLIDKYVKFA